MCRVWVYSSLNNIRRQLHKPRNIQSFKKRFQKKNIRFEFQTDTTFELKTEYFNLTVPRGHLVQRMLVIRGLLFRHFLYKKVSFVLLSACEVNLIFIKRSSYEVLPGDYYSHLSFSRLNALTKSESHFVICIELLTSRKKKLTRVKFPSRITHKLTQNLLWLSVYPLLNIPSATALSIKILPSYKHREKSNYAFSVRF